jgi:hypothetical protein
MFQLFWIGNVENETQPLQKKKVLSWTTHSGELFLKY